MGSCMTLIMAIFFLSELLEILKRNLLGKDNLEALQTYDTNHDNAITMDEVIRFCRSVPKRFNMKWFDYQAKIKPCLLENGRIHLNHSLWWFDYLDKAFDHKWTAGIKINVQDKYVKAKYESDVEVCKRKINDFYYPETIFAN